MADVRPFRALRFDPSRVDPALTIAPPYDVISHDQQRALYERSQYNIVRIEYGEQQDGDNAGDNRYTRAAHDLNAWQRAGVLTRDDQPAIYAYTLEFDWEGRRHRRHHLFAAVKLEEWEKGIVKPHEHTLSGPKADRLELLHATHTQVSPVYCVYDGTASEITNATAATRLCDFRADGQRHIVSAIKDADTLRTIARRFASAGVYIADGHHRYETALAYRDECRSHAPSWTGEEPENFVLMALTAAADPGLLVLPTHRLVNPPSFPADAVERVARYFDIDDLPPTAVDAASVPGLVVRLGERAADSTAFVSMGLMTGRAHLLTLRDRAGIEVLMPADQPAAWRRLDVSVLQYGILSEIFGIDDAALAAGSTVTYTQDPGEAAATVAAGRTRLAFLLNATPVAQVLAVADAGGRMPQKSTYFHPKLPTGLVLNALG